MSCRSSITCCRRAGGLIWPPECQLAEDTHGARADSAAWTLRPLGLQLHVGSHQAHSGATCIGENGLQQEMRTLPWEHAGQCTLSAGVSGAPTGHICIATASFEFGTYKTWLRRTGSSEQGTGGIRHGKNTAGCGDGAGVSERSKTDTKAGNQIASRSRGLAAGLQGSAAAPLAAHNTGDGP